jgi:Fe-S-cluster-containing dehydrogenase component/DMSO reductase anchor subunit
MPLVPDDSAAPARIVTCETLQNSMTTALPVLAPRATGPHAVLLRRSSVERTAVSLDPPSDGDLITALLAEQSSLTAVERFSQRHESRGRLARGRYGTLLPASPPGPGQQYAFEVDLDVCSGCKACVTACHNLNGLDGGEAWRDVGLLHGGTADQPFVQHVTTACHHCLDPACAKACPVDAYEKDPVTGIVRHLDDQCFGCQYCTLACPYDVPKYHKGKGIVRKCDLCSDRLAADEPPACVQACPHAAIKITVVAASQVIDDCEANGFLPGSPRPDYTLPTTTFKTSRSLPRNLLPADYYDVKPEHAHWPLVVMLVLTQLSVGGFIAEFLLQSERGSELLSPLHPVVSLGFGLLALAASTFHLGRPHLAFRSIVGIRHSWLSREALAFGAFAPLAIGHAALAWLRPDWLPERSIVQQSVGVAVCLTGLAGVGCGVMVYHVVRRTFWHAGRTATKFLGTAALLGLSTTVLMLATNAAVAETRLPSPSLVLLDRLCGLLALVAIAKLLFEAAHFRHLRDTRFTSLRRTALLMATTLQRATAARFALGVLGGVIVPLLMRTADATSSVTALGFWALVSFIAVVAGELAERYLFFTAVVRQKMPGGLTV